MNIKYFYINNQFIYHGLNIENLSNNQVYENYVQNYEQPNKLLYTKNNTKIKCRSIITLLYEEVFSFFYVFQLASFIIWINQEYYYYTLTVFLLSIITIIMNLYFTYHNEKKIEEISQYQCYMYRYKLDKLDPENVSFDQFEMVKSTQLCPGDIVIIPKHQINPCDIITLTGSVVSDEQIITGENQPKVKTSLHRDNSNFIRNQKQSLILAGTYNLDIRIKDQIPIGLVLQTGFQTTRGKIFNHIFFTKQVNQVEVDTKKFIGLMFVIAFLSIIVNYKIMKEQFDIGQKTLSDFILQQLNILTIAVPSVLISCLQTSIIITLNRLQKKEIYTKQPKKINLIGLINLISFDKTGTLTESQIVLDQIIQYNNFNKTIDYQNNQIYKMIQSSISLQQGIIFYSIINHSLTIQNNQIEGDPLELEIQKRVQYELRLSEDKEMVFWEGQHFIMYKRYNFESEKQRMTVVFITRDKYYVSMKGSPETVLNYCTGINKKQQLDNIKFLIKQGKRVIAVAGKKIENPNQKRSKLESDLEFQGFLVYNSSIKPESPNVIQELKSKKIKCLMVTGDNIYTSIYIGQQCNIIGQNACIIKMNGKNEIYYEDLQNNIIDQSELQNYQLAIDGIVFDKIQKVLTNEQFYKIIDKTYIFSRFKPEQKEFIQQLLKSIYSNSYTMFCGDGANDCYALKISDVGISLKQNESSVASPFTSNYNDISCVIDALKEGQQCLGTYYQTFKYQFSYTIIQIVCVTLLYRVSSLPSDPQFLWWDLFMVLPLTVSMQFTSTKSILSNSKPSNSLFSLDNLFSVIGIIVINGGFQILLYIFIIKQPWLVTCSLLGIQNMRNDNETELDEEYFKKCFEPTIIFWLSNFQYLISALIYNIDNRYRELFFKNYWFTFILLFLVSFNIALLMDIENLKYMFYILTQYEFNNITYKIPQYMFNFIFITIIGNAVVSFLWENVLVSSIFEMTQFQKLKLK